MPSTSGQTEIPLSSQSLRDLYQTIGGERGLRAILDAFYVAMSRDVLIGFFFDHKDLKQIADMQTRFLMRTWGVSSSYQGRSPRQAHQSLAPILSGHFDRRLVVLREVLEAHGLQKPWIDLWVNFEGKFRPVIVAE